MPGIELKTLNSVECARLKMNLDQCNSIGAVTGLPSFFAEGKPGVLQTLDPLAFGIRGKDGAERDYNLLIIGDSYDNAVLKLIASHYHRCYCADLRNYEREQGEAFHLGAFCREHEVDQVLILASQVVFCGDYILED